MSQKYLNIELKKANTDHKEEDTHISRGTWMGQLDFFMSCLGCDVGLGNVWRFPYLCYRNGGGAFMVPYVIMLVLAGMPLLLLQMATGQFCSKGTLSARIYAPVFKGKFNDFKLKLLVK